MNSRFTAPPARDASAVWSNGTKIIWFPDEVETHFEQPKNAFCLFRKTFEAPAGVSAARVRAFADSRYRLSINGTYVGRGPCRSDPRRQVVDELDAAAYIRPGINVVSVLALHYGYGTGQSIHRIPALVVEVELTTADGERLVIPSDESWKCRPAAAYDRSAPRVNGCQGPIEIFDSRAELPGWERPEFDDSGWAAAKGRGTKLSPFWNWTKREIPPLEEGEAAAKVVAWRGTLSERPGPPSRLHHQIMEESVDAEMAETSEPIGDGVVVEASRRGTATVVTFDLGSTEPGYLRLRATGAEGDIVDAVYAERLWCGKAPLSLTSNRPIDRFILNGTTAQELETAFAWRACRYVQLIVRNPGGPVTIHRVGLRTRTYPLERTAEFHCSDERLRRIWDISAHTLRLCMQDGFLDSSSREQQQWMGDGRWQAVINYHYSGDARLHRKLLEQIGQSQDPSGMTKARYPDGHHNYPPIPSFCLAWISSFGEYELYSGDGSLLPAWWPNVVHALRWFSAYANEDGLLEDVPYWPFIDWGEGPEGPVPDDQRGGVVTALNLQYAEALGAAAGYASRLGDEEAEAHYAREAARVRTAIRAVLWDDRQGAYVDCLVDGAASESVSEPTNALAILLLHEAGEERARRIGRRVFSGSAAGGAVAAGSPYFMLVIGRALVKLGWAARALELIRERYGAFLDAGSDTTWERWTLFHEGSDGSVSYSSASHAWGASPIVFIYEGIFGLTPLEGGFRRFAMDPDPCNLDDVRATLPVAEGEIDMSLERIDAESWSLAVSIPPGYSGRIAGRHCEAGRHTITIAKEKGT
ncbi:alpha-L-rhamnosidase [Paenibacillus antri]|uniref:Alpha-L-rhamnosidase n=1 Tax=Paenibacillus antri TaxID=2582848 RepID=A0A5R9FZS1_9BACL|nr:family 78 glycoside hydrolase catalytic domain [Paenibacillus antri]TLS49011.1 alpha-L-rhamnosidase [Paenibacillus antri]